ncbi:hypothetical protein BRM3_09010 [Brachybacterium huguangmaarense]|uniref:Uncharacterized protein n=1 Tax=Brachybacterium huguangmaarense TaxID=1652028 RepID=A0ABY6FZC7_9MICO|nr:hypothetical protein [Brachybacterium huguangmaarense]UYG15784.1 hypothetical protein BRM3_09010 [Brachybacterium huguangmaarense]
MTTRQTERRRRGRAIRRARRAGMTKRATLAALEWARVVQAVRDAWGRIRNTARTAVRSVISPRRRVITWETTPPSPPTYRHPRPVLTRRHR